MVVVAMSQHAGALGAIMLAQELAGRPLVLLAEDVVVEVLEELELDRFAEPFGGLDPVDHDPSRAADEMFIEKINRLTEDSRQICLPGMPVVGIEVAAGDATAGASGGVEVVADGRGEVPEAFEVEVEGGVDGVGSQVPAEVLPGVSRVILAVAPAREVADQAATALGRAPRVGPGQPQLRLARPGGPGHDGERARD